MEKYKKRHILVIILLILYFGICFPIKLEAFSITPSRAEILVAPNKKFTAEYTITNPENKPIRVKIFAEKFVLKEGRDATSWIKIRPKEVIIPANSSKKIKCEVISPKGVKGEYTSSLVFRSFSPTKVKEVGEMFPQLKIVTYVIIKGTEIVKGEISDIKVLDTAPLKISVKVKNFGNIHIRPKGEVEIIKIVKTDAGIKEGRIVSLFLNPIEGPIFQDAEGDIGPKSDDIRLGPGEYKAKVMVCLSPEVILNKEVHFNVLENGKVELITER